MNPEPQPIEPKKISIHRTDSANIKMSFVSFLAIRVGSSDAIFNLLDLHKEWLELCDDSRN